MTTLKKVYISGLRSFGTGVEDVQCIKFSCPLTVLLGQNGSGKTTVIEALKYACSGQLPEGCSKGQGFVHDPKLNDSYRVKGQVRLVLEDAKGTEFTVVKICEVTQKAQNLSFKRLDGTLSIQKPGGEKTDISNRCTDIDAQLRQIMGVSHAILNNVIFCHQENSNWPLSEGKKLKEKFDEIFEAISYNKCIKHMQKLIKENQTELKVEKERVLASQSRKEEVERMRNNLFEWTQKMGSIEEEIDAKKKSLEPLQEKIKKLLEVEKELWEVQGRLSSKETEIANLKSKQDFILKNLDGKEYEGDDAELKEEIESFANNNQKYQQRMADLERRKTAIEEEERKISFENTKLQVKIGQLKQEKTQFERLCETGNAWLSKLKEDFSLGFEASFESNITVKEAMLRIKAAIDSARQSLQELQKKHEAEDAELQRLIDDKNKTITEIKQSVQIKKDLLAENERKIEDIDLELQDLCFSDEQLNQLETKINSVEKDLEMLNLHTDSDGLATKIEQEKKKRRELQDELTSLEKIYRILQQNSDTEVEIDLQKNEIRKLESDINKLRSKNSSHFSKLFGDVIPENGLKNSIESLIKTEQKNCDEILAKVNVKEKKIAALTAKLTSEKDNLQKNMTELMKGKNQISEICKEKSLQDSLIDIEKTLERQQKEKGQLSAAKVIYEKFIIDFEKENACCPVCKTDFTNKKEAAQTIVEAIKTKIANIPRQLQKIEEELKKNLDTQSKLLQLKPVNEKIKTLTTDIIPSKQKEVEALETATKANKTELEALQKAIQEPKLRLELCRNVVSDAALIDQSKASLERCKSKIPSLEAKLLKVPSNRTKQQTEIDLDNAKESIRTAEQNCEAWQNKLEQFKSRCHQMNENKNSLVKQQLEIQKAVQNKPKLEEQLRELTEKQRELKEEIVELQTRLSPLEIEVEETRKRKVQERERNKGIYAEERGCFEKKVKSFEKLEDVQKQVETHLTKNVEALLEEAAENLQNNKRKLEACAEGKERIAKTTTELKTQLATQDALFKSLENNMLLRENRREEKRALLELEKIVAKVGNFNPVSVDNELQKLKKERQQSLDEINRKNGQREELAVRISDIEKDLNKQENRDALKMYKQHCYQRAAREASIKDLTTYTEGLEEALLEFHTSCMIKINERIRQLWREIYRGNDIDHIEIKTEATTSSGQRRSYNYKVVQEKNRVKLDMAGRCSAGQKVLASIIIRLALAERFSINCGILALDEPTTNLDRENVISLSNALANIVNNRRGERSFQLIVITHDEDFLQQLKHVDGISHFWRVGRNDRGLSVIKKTTF